MRALLICLLCCPLLLTAQKRTPLPHGMVFGAAPDRVNMHKAEDLETFMGKRTRTSAAVIGRVIRVTKPKGGWFEMAAGNGKIIQVHFQDYKTSLPADLKGLEVIIAGVASKQFVADDKQSFAGGSPANQPRGITGGLEFEATGLYVNR